MWRIRNALLCLVLVACGTSGSTDTRLASDNTTAQSLYEDPNHPCNTFMCLNCGGKDAKCWECSHGKDAAACCIAPPCIVIVTDPPPHPPSPKGLVSMGVYEILYKAKE